MQWLANEITKYDEINIMKWMQWNEYNEMKIMKWMQWNECQSGRLRVNEMKCKSNEWMRRNECSEMKAMKYKFNEWMQRNACNEMTWMEFRTSENESDETLMKWMNAIQWMNARKRMQCNANIMEDCNVTNGFQNVWEWVLRSSAWPFIFRNVLLICMRDMTHSYLLFSQMCPSCF